MEKEGYIVQTAMDGVGALASIEEHVPLVVVTDSNAGNEWA